MTSGFACARDTIDKTWVFFRVWVVFFVVFLVFLWCGVFFVKEGKSDYH